MRSARRPPIRRAASAALAATSAAVCATACGSAAGGGNGLPTGPATSNGRIQIVAGENTWGDIAAQIGGARVDVTSIIANPGQDPHEYESTVADAAAVAAASLVIENGAGYDDFMGRLASANGTAAEDILDVADVVGAADGANPHLWYDPHYVVTAAHSIEHALAVDDAAHAGEFRANLRRFLAGERQVSHVIATIRARHGGASVGYTEPVPGYLITAAGLRLGTPQAFSLALQNGVDPSPGDSSHFEEAITGHAIAALLYNPQVGNAETDRLVTLARDSGVALVPVTETLPPQDSFQTWQTDQASALLAALGG